MAATKASNKRTEEGDEKTPEQIRAEEARAIACELTGRAVLKELGTPPGFERVNVTAVSHNRFRVNVLVKTDSYQMRISDSHYVHAVNNGEIVKTDPPLVKKY